MKIKFLVNSYGNYKDDVVEIVQETDNAIYYYDEFLRYVYMLKAEEGILWNVAPPSKV